MVGPSIKKKHAGMIENSKPTLVFVWPQELVISVQVSEAGDVINYDAVASNRI